MYLTRLDVCGVRNIDSAQLYPAPGINLVYGNNGSGKTSLLEAIYLLGRGRSFRSRNLQTIINSHCQQCTVFASLAVSGGGQAQIPVGVERTKDGGFRFKVAGKQVYAASQLASTLPLLMMNSDSFGLIEGGPGNRRRFLDWGVFHVEQGFKEAWTNFQRSHKQRNYLLRHGKINAPEMDTWNREFVRFAEQVSVCRQNYFEKLLPRFLDTLAALCGLRDLTAALYQGWSSEKPLLTALELGLGRDVQTGTTARGPHRAEFKLWVKKKPAADVLSRGQEKLVVLALLIAQGQVLKSFASKQSVYLFDDLAAELDREHLLAGMSLLSELRAQVFVTGTDKRALLEVLPTASADEQPAMFHVKHGVFKREE